MELSNVNINSRVKIQCFNDVDLELKLLEFGITVGSHVFVQRKAPFGGPVLIETENGMVALRKNEACTLEVDVVI